MGLEKDKLLSFKDTGIRSGVMVGIGVSAGLISQSIWVGLAAGFGTGSFIAGRRLSIDAAERAKEFGLQGRKTRAYVEALRSSVDTVSGYALAGAMAGYCFGRNPEAILWSALGGAIFSFVTGSARFGFDSASSGLQSRIIN